MTNPSSFPSDHSTTGYIARHVAQNSAQCGVALADLALAIIDDLTDGDDDNSRAIRAAASISRLGTHLSDTQYKVADGNYAEAKRASKALIEAGGTT